MGLTWARYLIPLLLFLAAYGFGSQFVTDYRNMSSEITTLKREAELFKSRENGYIMRIERRDQAIEKSECKEKIQFWIKNPQYLPSAIPQPFSFGPHTR